MRPTDILKQEHRVIEQVLTCLEKIADQAGVRGVVDSQSARQALEFFQHFADRCHHAKEEHCLFPLLETKGFSPQQGPTGVMRHEHELGRHHLRALAGEIDRAAAGLTEPFCQHAHAYVQLMRQHIFKEDQRLFPMADMALEEDDQDLLMNAFFTMESQDRETDIHQKYLDLADELADRLQVPRARAEVPAGLSCGSQHHGS